MGPFSNDKIKSLRDIAGGESNFDYEKFAMIIIEECIDQIEKCDLTPGQSPAGEMAYDMTLDSLTEVRDDIRKRFGIDHALTWQQMKDLHEWMTTPNMPWRE